MRSRRLPSSVRIRRWGWLLACGLALSSHTGCHRSSDRDPLATALRYLDAAAAGDVETCYPLLDESVQRACDRVCLARILSRQRAEFRAARDELRAYLTTGRGEGVKARFSATMRFRDGSELQLIQAATGRKGRVSSPTYLIDSNPLSFYPQATPEQALRSFLLAVERKRWDVLVQFLPRSLAAPAAGPPYSAEQIEKRFTGPAQADIARQLTTLRQHLGEPIQLSPNGNEARLPVGDQREARLILEEGRWRVSQLE